MNAKFCKDCPIVNPDELIDCGLCSRTDYFDKKGEGGNTMSEDEMKKRINRIKVIAKAIKYKRVEGFTVEMIGYRIYEAHYNLVQILRLLNEKGK